jgi:hypothetical protein
MRKYNLILIFSAFILVSSCKEDVKSSKESETKAGETSSKVKTKARTADYNLLKNAYFGQTHQHTSWSFDAAILDVKTGPETAYRHARGERVKHPSGQEMQLIIPLDFLSVTDHSEYLGVLVQMYDPENPLSKNPLAADIVASGTDVTKSMKAFYGLVANIIQPDGTTQPDPELSTPELKRTAWQEMKRITDQYNEPGTFTTIMGYEWSSQPNMGNLHRNVLFRDTENLPEFPFSYFDSEKPEELWKWMDIQRENGSTLLAISHNGNLSNGTMFSKNTTEGTPIDRAYAESRMRNEPLTEIIQTKGQSETHPLMAPNDEFAGFEIWTKPVAGPGTVKVLETNYVRNAFRNGLSIEKEIDINPFKFGVVGGGDIHTAIVSHEEYNHSGEHNLKSSTPRARLLDIRPGEPSKIEQGTAGLSCVWAEENTRGAIYDAMARKETWATSGSRITLRVFGGYDFGNTQPGDVDWAKIGYDNGVPMGADMKSNSEGKVPQMMIWALKGPNSGNLDRIQVIKGWVDADGKTHEKIHEVVWSGDRELDANGKLPSVGNTVNIPDASYTNTIGNAELKTVWTDPVFDASESSFYYVRVLEIPTPRWSTYDAKVLGIAPPKDFPATIQERAWSSPIWYNAK